MKRLSLALSLTILFAAGAVGSARAGTTDVVRAVFEDFCGGVTNEVRRLSVDEAVRVLDETYARSDRYVSQDARRRLNRLLSEGLGEMFAFETFKSWERVECRHLRHYWLVHRMAEVELPAYDEKGCGFAAKPVFCRDQAQHPVVCPTNVVAWATSDHAKYLQPLVGTVQSFPVATSRVETITREVVADVENVQLVSLTQLSSDFDESRAALNDNDDAPVLANYRVTLRVRKALKGTDDHVRFSFPVVWGDSRLTSDERWLFYRGITLAVGFAAVDGVERVVRVDPVLPYPPFTKEKIVLFDSAEELAEAENPFAPIAKTATNDVRSLFVDYAGHTFVQYAATTNLITGCFGNCPDFSSTTCIRVRTDGAAARPDYWRGAWFGFDAEWGGWQVEEKKGEYDGNEARPRVSVLPALSCLAPEDVLPFAWRDIRFQSVSFRPPATMADVAAFFTVATKPFCAACPSHRFRVQAESAVARRVVRPYRAENVLAVVALSNICSRSGCAFAVEGTNVTIKAVLEEAKLVPPNIAELSARLEALGFASVRDAEYVWAYEVSTPLRARGSMKKEAEVFGLRDAWPGMCGTTWTRPSPAGTNRLQIVACRCHFWDVAQGDSPNEEMRVTVVGPARLEREIAKLVFALEEDEPVDRVTALAFAVHLYQKGFAKQAVRIVELLWMNPLEAQKAFEALCQRTQDVRRLYPTPAEWLSAAAKELGEDKKRKIKKEENDED